MTKFLHLADIHLGYNQYNSPERRQDFYLAFQDIIKRYAIGEAVDFVLIAGDFFDNRQLQPITMGRAVSVLNLLKQHHIPVYLIEGNHDNRAYSGAANWLAFLNGLDLIHLLEPLPSDSEEEPFKLLPWNPETRRGSYIDHGEVRVIGAKWFGSTTARIIPPFVRAIKELPPANYTALMFHAGLEGFINEYAGGLSYSSIQPFREVVNYLALGHFHKRFELDNWVFNPGSPEACSVSEAEYERGAYLVEVENGQHTVRHVSEYQRRPFKRWRFDLSRYESPEAATRAILTYVADQSAAWEMAPVIELTIHGHLGFKRYEMDLKEIETEALGRLSCLVFLLKFEAIPRDLPIAPEAIGADRRELEHRVIRDLIVSDDRFRTKSDEWTAVITTLKEMALKENEPGELYDYLANLDLVTARTDDGAMAY